MIERRGSVRVWEAVEADLPWQRYVASWQSDAQVPEQARPYDEETEWSQLKDAIAWGRRKAPVVMLLLGEYGSEMYNAGEKDAPGGPRWKGSRRRPAAGVDPDYGGQVFIREETPWIRSANTYGARWEEDDRTALERQDGFTDVEQAIDWGRSRAPVVLVAEIPRSYSGSPWYEVRSAGDVDPAGPPLERLRPRAGEAVLRWEFAAQLAPPADVDSAASRLTQLLAVDERVVSSSVSRRTRAPRSWSRPAVVGAGGSDSGRIDTRPSELLVRDAGLWLEAVLIVEAPTRKRAYETATRAFMAAVNGSVRPADCAFAGFTIRQAS